ncbi:hypothetical protein N825_25365 [Skermanella stibiiresistens SB22]|uniref:Peptidase S49 domain-containing protein n=1 Tax=Skermanella stibiiresistens SB22 TaxID=1385369 RepID=W9GVV6_9PROT|nr:S49 family peptidase [Skermanella stibiiresistens]EWY36766.1 hypothetical protein N825_25365 [Skermanella stibiiresistens SB22]
MTIPLITGPLPALVDPRHAAAMSDTLARIAQGKLPATAQWIGDAVERRTLYPVERGVAVIAVHGLLVPYLDYVGWPWATGYNVLRLQLEQAFQDPEIRGVLLHVNSGGGYASGCFDLVDWMAVAKEPAGKPIAAVVDDACYSAAYAIASAADSIACPRVGGVGSIGVVTLHLDVSAALEKQGYKVTVIRGGAHKTDGNPYEPLPPDVLADFTAEVEDLRTLFISTVARNRASLGLTEEIAGATEARAYSGPTRLAEALRLRLADAVASPDVAATAFINHCN